MFNNKIASLGAGIVMLASFTPALAAQRPTVVTEAATSISASAATLNGMVNPQGLRTSTWFDYGKTTSYGLAVSGTPKYITKGQGDTQVAASIAGLACGTTYHYRLKANNTVNSSDGGDLTFTTSPCASAGAAPATTTNAASSIGATSATLNGAVAPNGSSTTASFEYGATTSYGATLAATPSTIAGSASTTAISSAVSGLQCGTTYQFRATAVNASGTTPGANASFTTAACAASGSAPAATTSPATGVGSTNATLNANVAPGGSSTTVTFDYGLTTTYGASAAGTPSPIAATAPSTSVSSALAGLTCATTYHYRVRAANATGTTLGTDATFVTGACGGGSGSLRVSVGGFGLVTSSAGGISCGSVPSGTNATGTACYAGSLTGAVTLTAVPYNASFQFAGWAGDTTCTGSPCTLDMSAAKWVRAKFAPVAGANSCSALGLVGDKLAHALNGNFPALANGASFVDTPFGTTIRRITDVKNDGRGTARVLKPAYSTISAWNADESYLVLYRAAGNSGHELFNGKTYQFIRRLDDLPTADLEQFYWDTTKPNILYGVKASTRVMYRYDVDAPAGQRLTALRDFTAQCGTKSLKGGSDPFFSSWDSRQFGLACVSSGAMFGYNPATNTLGTPSPATEPRADTEASPQASASGTRLFLNQPKPGGGGNAVRLYDLNMTRGAFLDQSSGDDHASANRLANGDDTYNAVHFDVAESGTAEGTLVQWNLNGTPNGSNRITGRVIVGPATGYPYPPGGTHVGGSSFNRTGLLAASVQGKMTGATLLDGEILYVDSDPATNPGNAVCRVGHHRTASTEYWAEPHATISPSGTRILFGSSWGDASTAPVVNAYVVELPGYKP